MLESNSNYQKSKLDWVRLQQAAQYHQRIESQRHLELVIPCFLLKGSIK